eukprot:131186_1
MSAEHGFKQLHTIPLKFHHYHPKPLFYPYNSNEIIITTDYEEINSGTYKYNINSNKLELIHSYRYECQIENHAHFIDYKNEILYICAGVSNSFHGLNLKTNTMTNMGSNYSGVVVKSVLIPSTNKIHILKDYKNHFVFDCNDKMFTEINCNRDALIHSNICNLKLIYYEFSNQLMVLGGTNNDDIFYCNIKKQSTDKMEWKLNNKIKMPHIVCFECNYDIIVFGDVIIVFYFGGGGICGYEDIWCLDLLSHQWFKSEYNTPVNAGDESDIFKNNNNNNIHVLDFYGQRHFTINMYNLFSNELIKLRRKHYNKLVIGFIKQQENNNIIPTIPFVLKNLIAYYFQLFG